MTIANDSVTWKVVIIIIIKYIYIAPGHTMLHMR